MSLSSGWVVWGAIARSFWSEPVRMSVANDPSAIWRNGLQTLTIIMMIISTCKLIDVLPLSSNVTLVTITWFINAHTLPSAHPLDGNSYF